MIDEVVEIARKAGEKIMEIYEKDFEIEYKVDKSPLTEADHASNRIICERLKKITPDIPILSEESNAVDYDIRKQWKNVWIVDPLDGTKEFIKRNGEFTVNIALVEEDTPVMGVVHLPAKGITYFADENGSYKKTGKKKATMLSPRNAEKSCLRVVASRSHLNDQTKEFIEKKKRQYDGVEVVQAGSSLKICLIAEGSADIYPRLAPTMEWDTAAAHAIVKYAGKNIYEYNKGEKLRYNKKKLTNPSFIVE